MGGCFAFWLLCACDKKKFVHTFGLIRRRRRPKKRATKREIDQMSNVKDKKEKKGGKNP